MSMNLHGKTAVVTGGTRGIGLAITRALLAAGAKVLITGRTQETLDLAVADLGGGARGFASDVSKEADVQALADHADTLFGGVDILVNNAGINPWYKRAEHTELSEWQHIIDVNLTGVFLCTRTFGRAMLEREHGSIINITSVGAHTGLTRAAAYCAAKAGVEALAKSLTKDWAARGVRINNVAPGYVNTDLTAGIAGYGTLREAIEARTPVGRFAEPDEMAGAVVYLASDAASYVSGTTIAVDGGWIAT